MKKFPALKSFKIISKIHFWAFKVSVKKYLKLVILSQFKVNMNMYRMDHFVHILGETSFNKELGISKTKALLFINNFCIMCV